MIARRKNARERFVLRMRLQVRVSAKTLAGYGVPSREALLCTRVAPPSAPKMAPSLVSATPNSVTVGWIPPKYENGEETTGLLETYATDPHIWKKTG